MNVWEITAKYLKENGFDGLCSTNCGCLTADLFICSSTLTDLCQPGYNNKELAEENECNFWISEQKPYSEPSKSG